MGTGNDVHEGGCGSDDYHQVVRGTRALVGTSAIGRRISQLRRIGDPRVISSYAMRFADALSAGDLGNELGSMCRSAQENSYKSVTLSLLRVGKLVEIREVPDPIVRLFPTKRQCPVSLSKPTHLVRQSGGAMTGDRRTSRGVWDSNLIAWGGFGASPPESDFWP